MYPRSSVQRRMNIEKHLAANATCTSNSAMSCDNSSIPSKNWINSSPDVLCPLLNSFSVPILMYAAESLNLTENYMRNLENAYLQAFYEMFNTFDNPVVEQWQYYMGCLPMRLLIDTRNLTEHHKIIMNVNHPKHNIHTLSANNEFHSIWDQYHIPATDHRSKSKSSYQDLIWNFLRVELSRYFICLLQYTIM